MPPIASPHGEGKKLRSVAARKSRGWFVVSVILGVVGSALALIGDRMFAVRSRGLNSSQSVIRVAGDWAVMGFGGAFLMAIASLIFLWALILWLQEKRNSLKP